MNDSQSTFLTMTSRSVYVKHGYLHSDLTAAVIGMALDIHKALGNGYPEQFYQRALSFELEQSTLQFNEEVELPVIYKKKVIGRRKADFLIKNCLVVEIKAVSAIEKKHVNQILNYLKVYQCKVGLLINFGQESLIFKRYIQTNH